MSWSSNPSSTNESEPSRVPPEDQFRARNAYKRRLLRAAKEQGGRLRLIDLFNFGETKKILHHLAIEIGERRAKRREN